jgi:hypothetical protein
MNDPHGTDPREQLRRLADALDEELPDHEEGRIGVAAMGVDLDAMMARIRARVAAFEAARARRRNTRVACVAVVLACVAAAGVIALRAGTPEQQVVKEAAIAPTPTTSQLAVPDAVSAEPTVVTPSGSASARPRRRRGPHKN